MVERQRDGAIRALASERHQRELVYMIAESERRYGVLEEKGKDMGQV